MTETKTISAALAKAQSEMSKALKDSDNPHFKSKYADLAAVMDACMPALNKYGIAVIQPFVSSDFGNAVKTVLIHEGGETLECSIPLILGKNDMQGLGSAITYARRYGLMAMAGIAPEDDDGNAAAASAKNNHVGESIGDTWRDAVLDRIPENATPRQKAEAFAAAIREDFKDKGRKALDNRWARHKTMIEEMQRRFPDLAEAIVDAFETRKNELEDIAREASGMIGVG
jgi:hypothetical protein